MCNCYVCEQFSGRREICYDCAVILWPHRKVNDGAKALHRKLMAVQPIPPMVLSSK